MNILFFDTETTGFPKKHLSMDDSKQPHIVQIAALMCNADEEEIASMSLVICRGDWSIPAEASAVHGITDEHADACGVRIGVALSLLGELVARSDVIVAHNAEFDRQMVEIEYLRGKTDPSIAGLFSGRNLFCTMLATTPICRLPGNYGDYKWPKLIEAHQHLFGCGFDGAHDVLADVRACKRVYFEIKKPVHNQQGDHR